MTWKFSSRTSWDISESAFSEDVSAAKKAGQSLIDLTISNPTLCEFAYDSGSILDPLRNASAMQYDPDPRGIPVARRAVAHYYAGHRATVTEEQIILTTSTSESYGYLFQLLCDPDDEVLIAQPSYPLFDYLAELPRCAPAQLSVVLRPRLVDRLSRAGARHHRPHTSSCTRSSNNPTGHATSRVERERLEEICLRHGLALVVDEVFLDYPVSLERILESFTTAPHPVPTFVLSGMSKVAGLPQMKAAWIVVCGPSQERKEALGRLEIVSDTFLSVNAPTQLALPVWLRGRQGIQDQIKTRIRNNLAAIATCGVEVLPVDAGWSAILRLPQLSGDPAECRLLREGVICHPGSFYGIPESGRVVVSTIVPIELFRQGMALIGKGCAGQL